MQKHFVQFLSPGTFVSEMTEKPIDSWDVEAAVLMAADIKERYGAKPYGFRFTTRERGDDDLDSKQSAQSGIYYLGGKVETLAEVEARNDPKERILLANMKGNGIDKIVINDNSWRFTAALHENDVVLAG
jgi:hypothetical protein